MGWFIFIYKGALIASSRTVDYCISPFQLRICFYCLIDAVYAQAISNQKYSVEIGYSGSYGNMVLPWTLIGFSETRIASSMASVLNATTPIWTMLVGLVFFGAVFHRLQWLGMCLAFIGIIILLGINPAFIISVDPIGFGCMLLATLCYGFGTQLSRRILTNLSMYHATFATLLGAVVGGGIMMAIIEKPDLSIILVPDVFGSLIGLGILGSGVAYILFNYMILRGSAEFASTVTYFVPVSAIVWVFLLLNEHIGWNVLAGLALILGGVFMANQSRTVKLAG